MLRVMSKVFSEEFRRAIAFTTALGVILPTGAIFAASDTLNVSAKLRVKLAVTTVRNLQFGAVLVDQSPSGALEIRPDGSVVTTGTGLNAGASAPQVGQVDILGEADQPIDLSCSPAMLANQQRETFPFIPIVADRAVSTGTYCAGGGVPVLALSQASSSVYIGGLINASDLVGLKAFEEFSTGRPSGTPAVFKAVYQ